MTGPPSLSLSPSRHYGGSAGAGAQYSLIVRKKIKLRFDEWWLCYVSLWPELLAVQIRFDSKEISL
jgi:hypothetical protein